MEKRYCEKCGSKLFLRERTVSDGCNSRTGEKLTHKEYQWECPNYLWAIDSSPIGFFLGMITNNFESHTHLEWCKYSDYEVAHAADDEKWAWIARSD
jgi:DNA-directed RNA polymerase subunit RPC12/RpoP